MKNIILLIAVISLLLIWAGSVYSQPQNQQLGIQQVAPPPPQTLPVAPPPRANTGMNEELRKKLADQILNNKNLNLNTLIQHLRQIRTNRSNRQQAAIVPGQAGIGAGQRQANRAGQRGQGQGRAINRAGRGLGPGQGQGRGAGNLGQGLGPGQDQGRGAGNLGQGLGSGQGQGRGASNIGQGLGPGQGQGRGAGNVSRRLGQGLGRGAANVGRGRGQVRGRGIGNVGRGFNLRLRDGSCLYLELQRPGARAGIRNIPPTRGRGLSAGAGLGRGLGRGAGVVGRGRGLGVGIIRDEQQPPDDELYEQLEQLNEQELNQVLEEIQQVK